jgi:hypothetical protein
VAGGAGGLEIAGRHHDVHEGRQEPRAQQRIGRGVQRPADAARRGVGAPLDEPQQGQPGLPFTAELVRAAVVVLGGVELPAQPVDLGLLVERAGGDLAVRPAR